MKPISTLSIRQRKQFVYIGSNTLKNTPTPFIKRKPIDKSELFRVSKIIFMACASTDNVEIRLVNNT